MIKVIFTLEHGSEWVPEMYYPVPASKEIPEWYKNMKTTDHPQESSFIQKQTFTMKKCMPVFDSMTAGYLIKTFTDLNIGIADDGTPIFNWAFDVNKETRNNNEFIAFHHPIQAKGYKSLEIKQPIGKFRNPWGIKTPKGYSCLFISPTHRPSHGVRILEGVVDTDTYFNSVQFPFMFEQGYKGGTIPAGTPIAQVIPFKREEFQMSIGGDKERKDIDASHNIVASVFMNGYRNLLRSKKTYL